MRRIGLIALLGLVAWALWRGWLPWPDWLPEPPWQAPLPRIELPTGPLTGTVERIVIDKSDRMMIAIQDGRPARVYTVALGFAPQGDKLRQGDGRTPEGLFRVDRRNDRSKFHLSLGLDYPHPEDRRRAAAQGLDPGGDIFIHGQPNGRVEEGHAIRGDWTDGCIAVSDAEIRELFAATPIGTEVEIRP